MSSLSHIYDLFGLRVRSTISLEADCSSSRSHDLEVRALQEHKAFPLRRKLAQCRFGANAGYRLGQGDGGYLLEIEEGEGRRFRALFSEDLRLVQITARPDACSWKDAVQGSVPLAQLILSGERPLHASCVAWEDRAAAVVGDSGSGKSTVAALLCAAGGSLVTDDVLRLKQKNGRYVCYFGPRRLRLRPESEALHSQLESEGIERTWDNRLALSLPRPNQPRPTLRAIVFPRTPPTYTSVALNRLPAPAALVGLARACRMTDLTDRVLAQRQLQQLAEIASRVPVFELIMPAGPPFHPEIAPRIRELVTW